MRSLFSLPAAGVVVAGMLLAAWPAKRVPAAEPTTKPEPNFALRPLTYFNQYCANCHGEYGSFYGEGFAKDLPPAELHTIVEEMAAGPAMMPLDGAALESQVAWHRALAADEPFLTARVEEKRVLGEASPGATVTVKVGDKSIPVTLDGHRWQSEPLPEDASNVTAAAQRDDKQTTLNNLTNEIQFSHAPS